VEDATQFNLRSINSPNGINNQGDDV